MLHGLSNKSQTFEVHPLMPKGLEVVLGKFKLIQKIYSKG